MPIRYYKVGIALALILLVPAAIYFFTPVKQLFEHTFLVTHLPKLGFFAPLLFVLLCALSGALPLPGNLLTIAGGAVFGLFWGTIWATVGISLGAVASFWIVRSLLHTQAKSRFGEHPMLLRLEQAIHQSPLNLVLAARIAPIAPLSLFNILFGLTPVTLKTYTLGTCVGILPGRAVYSWLGVTGKKAINGGDVLPLFLALTCITLLSIAPLLLPKKQ